MSVILKTYNPNIRQHFCKRCGDLLCESGYLRQWGVKELRMIGTWHKENYGIRTLTHPLRPNDIICIDVYCICNRCGIKNIFIVDTALDDKDKIKVSYNRIEQGQGKLYT